VTPSKKVIDIIAAVRNEEEVIPLFVAGVKSLSLPNEVEVRTFFVEDSSTDKTRSLLRDLASKDPAIRYIFLKKGYGQAAALALGLSRSDADAMIIMDVDGGHPLHIIPRMIEGYIGGADAVQGIRRSLSSRHRYRDFGTAAFNRIFWLVTGIQTARQNVYYRLVSQSFARILLADNRWKHFLRIDYNAFKQLRTSYVEFDAAERMLGASKYNFKRLLNFAIIAILSSISRVRFVMLLVLLLLISVAGAFYIWPFLALPGIALGFYLLCKFYKMSKNDVLAHMELDELPVHSD
jgi:glycosyltransferase involved in cell wall biosynthesis